MSDQILDYSYCNQAFIDGLNIFLDYTDPDPSTKEQIEGLILRRCLQKKEFKKRSIQRWAISELIGAITNDPYHPIEDIVYRFTLKLCSFEKHSIDADMRNVFHMAEDFIEKEIISLFREKEEGTYP